MAKDSSPLVVSWPAMRNVMHCARMLASGRRSPDCLSNAVQHAAEQVPRAARVAGLLPLPDDLVDHLVHQRLVGRELPGGAEPEPGLDLRGPGPGLRLLQRADHGRDERVRGAPVEGVEPVAEAAQGDRVQRQAGHVGGDVDLVVGVEPLPLQHQLAGHVQHHRVVVPHRLLAEVRQQDVVRPQPQRIVGVGGEQARAHRIPAHRGQAAGDQLVEPPLVAHLLDQVRSRHHVPRVPAGHHRGGRSARTPWRA